MMAAASANAQALANQGFPGGLSGLPNVPSAAQLLAALISKIVSTLGIPMVAHSPCGMQCLLAMIPLVPCPIALALAAKQAAQALAANPPVSINASASASGSASGGAGSGANASGSGAASGGAGVSGAAAGVSGNAGTSESR